jgi:exopolysaccharide production protein ExoY
MGHGWKLIVKRAMDIVISAIGLILLSPFLLGVSILVYATSPGHVFFRQRRLGLGGRMFSILKFRTMHANAERRLRDDPELYRTYVVNDYKLPPDRDPRITPIGRLLRKSSLDELPQLINVLVGTMSLVGPRPVVPDEIAVYGDRQHDLLSVRPGITGHWQVSGRSNVPYPERCDLELYYVYNWSLSLDFKILLLTVPSVLRGVGAH